MNKLGNRSAEMEDFSWLQHMPQFMSRRRLSLEGDGEVRRRRPARRRSRQPTVSDARRRSVCKDREARRRASAHRRCIPEESSRATSPDRCHCRPPADTTSLRHSVVCMHNHRLREFVHIYDEVYSP